MPCIKILKMQKWSVRPQNPTNESSKEFHGKRTTSSFLDVFGSIISYHKNYLRQE